MDFVYEIDSKEDQTFRKFVQNKKVIVGLPVKNENGFEIDNADIVLRTNYKIGDQLLRELNVMLITLILKLHYISKKMGVQSGHQVQCG